MQIYPEPPSSEPNLIFVVIASAFAIAIGMLLIVQFLKRFLYIARPNEALIFSGRRYRSEDGSLVGSRIVKSGHRALRIPIWETVNRLPMNTIPIDIHVQQAYSRGNIPLRIHAVANVKFHSDPRFLRNAVERFLDAAPQVVENTVRQTLEGVLREVLALLTPEEVNEDRLKFAEKLIQAVEDDLQILGFELDTLKIQNVSDETGYLDSVGRPVIAAALRDAENAENQAMQEIAQSQALATQRAEMARVSAQTATLQRQNGLRRLLAELEGEAQSVEREAEAAAKTARAQAEKNLQSLRVQLEQRRLQADVVIPAEVSRQANAILAKGAAAPTVENGAAAVEVLRLMSEAWSAMGSEAKELYVIQHLEEIVGTVVGSVNSLRIGEVNIVDQGDGEALASYAAMFPKIVASVMEAVSATTGVDVPLLLKGSNQTAQTS